MDENGEHNVKQNKTDHKDRCHTFFPHMWTLEKGNPKGVVDRPPGRVRRS